MCFYVSSLQMGEDQQPWGTGWCRHSFMKRSNVDVIDYPTKWFQVSMNVLEKSMYGYQCCQLVRFFRQHPNLAFVRINCPSPLVWKNRQYFLKLQIFGMEAYRRLWRRWEVWNFEARKSLHTLITFCPGLVLCRQDWVQYIALHCVNLGRCCRYLSALHYNHESYVSDCQCALESF